MDINELKVELEQAKGKLDIFETTANNMDLDLTERQRGFLLGKRQTINATLGLINGGMD